MDTTSTLRTRQAREAVVIRFAGDSGDGMQVTGSRFTVETALAGNDLTTFPDFPAEIRAPAGTTFGVSAFQIQFGARDVVTPGDAVDVLVAMNPAALKVEVKDLRRGGTVLVDTGAFTERNLTKAGFPANPLEDGSLAPYQVLTFDITRLTTEAVKPFGLSSREAHRCRNMWALGLMLWMYGRDRQATIEWLHRKFADRAELAQASVAAVNAGHAFGETAEMSEHLVGYTVPSAPVEPGRYRTVSGTEALAWGLIAGMRAAGLEKMIFAGYPITPASLLLHTLANLKAYGAVTFQAEDEIAAIGAAIGAAYSGALGVTSSSGPGMALKTEMLGLAIATELPIVVINSQRAGPLRVDHHDRQLGGDREPEHLGLERHPGAGARGDPQRSAVRRTDRGADRGDLVLRLERDHPVRLEVRQGVEQRRGGSDRVAREDHLLEPGAAHAGDETPGERFRPTHGAIAPRRDGRARDRITHEVLRHLGGLAEGVAGIHGRGVGLGELGPVGELAAQPLDRRLPVAAVHP